MKYLLLSIIISILVCIIYGQGTQCDCELGIYLKNINGKCTGELKHFDTPEFGEGCLEIFGDLELI